MGKRSFQFERFDIRAETGFELEPAGDGEWVKAEEAINREAVLQAEIRTLEAQLKDAREESKQLAAFVVAVGGMWGETKSKLVGELSLAESLNRDSELAERYHWLEQRFIGPDFAWGADRDGRPLQVLVFRIDAGTRVSVDLAATIDAVRA